MKSHRILFTIAILTLIGLFVCAVQTATAATPAKTPPPIDPRKLVKSVDVKTSTVVLQFMRDKSLHTYTIDDRTVLQVNNVAGKVTDIKAGMVVDDFLERTDTILDSLTLSGYGAEPSTTKSKTPAKPPAKPKTSTQTDQQSQN